LLRLVGYLYTYGPLLLNVGFAMEMLDLVSRMLHLPDSQTGEAWVPSNKMLPSRIQGNTEQKITLAV
jgi:hypothetical protein